MLKLRSSVTQENVIIRDIIGNLNNDDGNGNENVTRKYIFISFVLLRDYFNSLNFAQFCIKTPLFIPVFYSIKTQRCFNLNICSKHSEEAAFLLFHPVVPCMKNYKLFVDTAETRRALFCFLLNTTQIYRRIWRGVTYKKMRRYYRRRADRIRGPSATRFASLPICPRHIVLHLFGKTLASAKVVPVP